MPGASAQNGRLAFVGWLVWLVGPAGDMAQVIAMVEVVEEWTHNPMVNPYLYGVDYRELHGDAALRERWWHPSRSCEARATRWYAPFVDAMASRLTSVGVHVPHRGQALSELIAQNLKTAHMPAYGRRVLLRWGSAF